MTKYDATVYVDTKQHIARQKIVSFTKTTIRYEIVFAKFEER
jgi:hypothetical protein